MKAATKRGREIWELLAEKVVKAVIIKIAKVASTIDFNNKYR